jgi:protein translocase SecG subunit
MAILLSIFIIVLVLLKVPNNSGLESMVMKPDFLGSPSSTEKNLTLTLGICIFIYLILAIQLNIQN